MWSVSRMTIISIVTIYGDIIHSDGISTFIRFLVHEVVRLILTQELYLSTSWGRYLFTNINVKFLLIFKFANHRTKEPFVSPTNKALAPVPEKTISANRGLNPANRGIKFVHRLDCVRQNTISTIPRIK